MRKCVCVFEHATPVEREHMLPRYQELTARVRKMEREMAPFMEVQKLKTDLALLYVRLFTECETQDLGR